MMRPDSPEAGPGAPSGKQDDPDVPPTQVVARTASAAETMALAGALAGALGAGDIVLLAGDLGAGKTTFTKGLASALGVSDLVTSPTFTLLRSYPTTTESTAGLARPEWVTSLVHADLFRLDRLREVLDLAIGEMLEDGAVAVVEWGDLAVPVLGRDALVVSLAQGSGSDERSVCVELGARFESRREEIEERLNPWS
jgi:tRNA threonylcarbamoyladenosine biosynthesis protein TsaE